MHFEFFLHHLFPFRALLRILFNISKRFCCRLQTTFLRWTFPLCVTSYKMFSIAVSLSICRKLLLILSSPFFLSRDNFYIPIHSHLFKRTSVENSFNCVHRTLTHMHVLTWDQRLSFIKLIPMQYVFYKCFPFYGRRSFFSLFFRVGLALDGDCCCLCITKLAFNLVCFIL